MSENDFPTPEQAGVIRQNKTVVDYTKRAKDVIRRFRDALHAGEFYIELDGREHGGLFGVTPEERTGVQEALEAFLKTKGWGLKISSAGHSSKRKFELVPIPKDSAVQEAPGKVQINVQSSPMGQVATILVAGRYQLGQSAPKEQAFEAVVEALQDFYNGLVRPKGHLRATCLPPELDRALMPEHRSFQSPYTMTVKRGGERE